MPQLDTTYFVSQIFWLSILFVIFYLSIKYLILPRIESIIKNRILVVENSDKARKKYTEEIEQIKALHKNRADEVRAYIKQLQLESNSKFDDFKKKTEIALQKTLDKEIADSNDRIEKFVREFHVSKDSNDSILDVASRIIEEMTSIKADKVKLKKYVG